MPLKDKQIRAIEKRIVDISEADTWLNVLLYGMNGTQKTRFAATAENVVIMDVDEKGTKSARNLGGKVFPVKKWADAVYFMWYLREGNHKFEAVAVDNLTRLQQMCMSSVLKEAEDRDPNRDPDSATMRDWGKVTEKMKPFILNLRNLEMHTIFIAQERQVEDDEEETMYMPDLPKAVRGIATGAVDIIGRTYQKEVRKGKKGKSSEKVWEPRMLVGPSETFVTKDRTGQLPRIVRRPTVPMFVEAAGHLSEED